MKKIVNLILLVLFIAPSGLRASVSELQVVKISIFAKNQQVKNVFSQIEEKTGYAIVYEQGIIDPSRKVDISVTNESVDRVLDKVLAQTGNEYTFVNGQIIITKKKAEEIRQQQPRRVVTGLIVDENGIPVIGAGIVVDGTATGTVSDLDGKFQLNVPAEKNNLTISYLGYQTQQVSILNRNSVDIKLVPEDLGLEEVVVIGYGTVKKRDLTGAVASVKSDDIVQIPTSNALEAIQGRVPGMDIVRTSGSAGSGVSITIRGTKTIGYTDETGKITRNTDPLFIIDGVQGGSYEDLNPADIESIDVLKDASSTAIYGSLGANGVVIITTKKGKSSNKINVSYNGHYGINGWVDYPKPRMGESYIQLRREAYRAVGQWSSTADDIGIFSSEEWSAIQNNQWVNWVDLVTRNGIQQSHNVTFSSGKENVRSYISASYFNEKGIFKNDDMNRYTLRSNIDYDVNKWLKAGVNSQITYSERNRVPGSILTQAISYTPLGTPYNEDGSINMFPVSGNKQRLSPLANYSDEYITKDNTAAARIFAVGYLEVNPIRQLRFRTNIATSLEYSRRGEYHGENSTEQFGKGYKNQASITEDFDRFYTWDNILTFSENFGGHILEATAISTWTKSIVENHNSTGQNQMLNSNLFYNLGSTESGSRLISSDYVGEQKLGFAGRISYNYNSKYLLTVTGRWDGSSALAPGQRWDFFPSISGAWRMSEEAFMENTRDILSDLKIRLSYGVSGNSVIPAYKTQGGTLISSSKFGFNDNGSMVYLFSPSIGNPYTGWEKSKNINLGFDAGFINNRINLGIDLYNINTNDILKARSLPPSTGAGGTGSSQLYTYQNICKTNNKGIEIALNTTNIVTKDFRWSTTFTFAANKEKITELINDKDDLLGGQNIETTSLLIGRPIDSFYSYKLNGIWQLGEEEEMAKYKLNGVENKFKPGMLKVADINGDYDITADDRTYLGSKSPKWTGGLNNTFYYKGFDLNIYLYMRWGQMIDAQFLGRYNPSGLGNAPGYLDYWTPENPTNDFPRPQKDGNIYDNYGYMSLNYADGSYFKIKNISLGYTLPKTITNQWGIGNLKFYVTASNLFTVAKSHLIKHYDPERGGDEKEPLSKQLVVGLNLNF